MNNINIIKEKYNYLCQEIPKHILDNILLSYYKKSYPNYDYYIPAEKTYDLNKWLEAARNIYYYTNRGYNKKEISDNFLMNWSEPEKFAFSNWLRFYEEGAHMKYKIAQHYMADNGYFLPNAFNQQPAQPLIDSNFVSKDDSKQIIESVRKKILQRLNSVEKLLNSDDGDLLVGNEANALLEAVHQLKRKIRTLNKISKSDKMYIDMIIREANILNNNGFLEASSILYKTANNNIPTKLVVSDNDDSQTFEDEDDTNAYHADGNSTTAVGLPGNTWGNTDIAGPVGPGAPGSTPTDNSFVDDELNIEESSVEGLELPDKDKPNDVPDLGDIGSLPSPSAQPAGLDNTSENPLEQLTDLLGNAGISSDDDLNIEDSLMSDDDLYLLAYILENDIVKKAQLKPDADKVEQKPIIQEEDFDKKIDALLSTTKVQDVLKKLEELSTIFKVREIPRQLALVDMMLHALGLSTFFATLGEAENKALEMHSYISSRIESILAQLRGSITSTDHINLTESPEPTNLESQKIKQNLTQEQLKEENRKKVKKEMADQALDNIEVNDNAPDLEVQEDLSEQPPQKPQPVATKPAPQPTAQPPV